MRTVSQISILASLLYFSAAQAADATDAPWYSETLYPEWHQAMRIDKIIEREETGLQALAIFENDRFGGVLALDGVVQTTQADEFVYKNTKERFDVIICDSTDPIGPGVVLFTKEFYGNCKKILKTGGIFVNQNGVPFMQTFEVRDTYQRRKHFFKDTGFYVAAIPTYVGGFMALGYATDETSYRELSLEELNRRLQKVEGELKYYNAEIHRAAFALPNFVKKQFAE